MMYMTMLVESHMCVRPRQLRLLLRAMTLVTTKLYQLLTLNGEEDLSPQGRLATTKRYQLLTLNGEEDLCQRIYVRLAMSHTLPRLHRQRLLQVKMATATSRCRLLLLAGEEDSCHCR